MGPAIKTVRGKIVLSKTLCEDLWEDREWFLAGCPDHLGVRQRRARLSESGAVLAWSRFLLLVQFVDEWYGMPQGVPAPGLLGSVWERLNLKFTCFPFVGGGGWAGRLRTRFLVFEIV